MLILALETSTPLGSVALSEGPRLIAERLTEPARGHGGGLINEVDALLAEVGVPIAAVALFVASAGPGSFTGVRVGLSTANALAWATQKPACAFNSLACLAQNGRGLWGALAPMIDARKREVYGALYQESEGRLLTLIEPFVAPPAALRARILDRAGDIPVHFLGTGATTYPDVLPPAEGLDGRVRAASLCALAADRLARGLALPPAQPRYVRPSEAEVKFGPAPAHDPMAALLD